MADQDKPAAPAINLDSLKRDFTPEPFAVVLGGKRFVFSDALDLDWQDLTLALGTSPRALFRLIVPADDQDQFFATDLPTWKMRALMDAYVKHYRLEPERQ